MEDDVDRIDQLYCYIPLTYCGIVDHLVVQSNRLMELDLVSQQQSPGLGGKYVRSNCQRPCFNSKHLTYCCRLCVSLFILDSICLLIGLRFLSSSGKSYVETWDIFTSTSTRILLAAEIDQPLIKDRKFYFQSWWDRRRVKHQRKSKITNPPRLLILKLIQCGTHSSMTNPFLPQSSL